MDIRDRYGCAILAGGAGSRMGHVNKADLEYEGKTFADSIMSEMEKTGMPCYYSAANYDRDKVPGWKLVKDAVTSPSGGYIGPMGGIYSCLANAREDGTDGLFFAPCDAPLYTAEAIEKLMGHIDAGTDAVIFRTGDGRLQTTFGWYSVNCLQAMKEDIGRAGYKLAATLEKLNCKIVDTRFAGISDEIFTNINKPEDHRDLLSRHGRKHILITGGRQIGKTTLIETCTEDIAVPVYGYKTKRFGKDPDGISRTYIYPAGDCDYHRSADNYIGSTREKLLDVRIENFEQLGTLLVRSAKPGGIIVMDEIGFMESRAPVFRKAVMDALDGDIHVIAAVRKSDKQNDHIEAVKSHPGAELIELTEENRDEITARIKSVVRSWEKEMLRRKESGHE